LEHVVSGHLQFGGPPSWAQRFRSDDVSEVREFVGRSWGQVSRVVRGTGALGFEQTWLAGTAVTAGWVGTALGETIRAAAREPILHVVIPAGSAYRFGRRRHFASQRTVTFIAPGWEYTLDRPAGNAFAVAAVGRPLRDEVAARLPGGGSELVFQARPIELDQPAEAVLLAAVGRFVASTAQSADHAPSAHGEAALLEALAGVLLSASVVVRAQSIASARLADLEAWIDAHLERPITVGRLCQVAGIGERALQKAFESRRGMSPLRFVAERRLAAARRLLTGANPTLDVTEVAMGLGFGHTGRFALLYRQAFGETPSQSLRQARRPRQPVA
jgi:AraC-like DNA-binding protein